MGKHIKSERRALSRKRAKALLELQAAAPESYLRFMAAEAGLKQISISDNERYREFRRPAKAALACLDYEQRWLTAQQIADLVERGGYPDWDPIRQQGLFVRALNVSAKHGNIQRVDDKLGKPKWHYPLADPDPEKESKYVLCFSSCAQSHGLILRSQPMPRKPIPPQVIPAVLITPDEFGRRVNRSPKTVRRWADEGRIGSVNFGKGSEIVFRESDVNAFIAGHYRPAITSRAA